MSKRLEAWREEPGEVPPEDIETVSTPTVYWFPYDAPTPDSEPSPTGSETE